MKRFGIAILLLLVLVYPAAAQNAPACTVDVSAVQALLTEAATAESEAAVALVAHARDALLAIEQGCADAGVYVLDQQFSLPEGTFTVSYPHGWSVGTVTPSATGGVVFLGSTSDPDALLQVAEPVISGGEQAVQLLVGVPGADEANPLEAVLKDFEDLIRVMYTEVSTTEYYTLEERSAARISFRSTGFDGIVVALDLGDGRFAVVRGVAAPGRLEAIRGVAEAIALSVLAN